MNEETESNCFCLCSSEAPRSEKKELQKKEGREMRERERVVVNVI